MRNAAKAVRSATEAKPVNRFAEQIHSITALYCEAAKAGVSARALIDAIAIWLGDLRYSVENHRGPIDVEERAELVDALRDAIAFVNAVVYGRAGSAEREAAVALLAKLPARKGWATQAVKWTVGYALAALRAGTDAPASELHDQEHYRVRFILDAMIDYSDNEKLKRVRLEDARGALVYRVFRRAELD